jgi:hypothetical protein
MVSLRNFIKNITQVTEEENTILTAPFSEEEVKAAIFQMKHNKALGSDGFPVKFYQKLWDIIKGDMIIMFQELHLRNLPLFSLNFGVISLTPKAQDVNRIQQYRPRCLLNVTYKISLKLLQTELTR